MKFLNILLKEGRKEDLKKKYFDKYDEEDLDFILGISDLQDFNHKYTDWVLKHLLEYADVIEVAEIAVGLVKDFDKYQKNLEKKDINQYLSIDELDNALAPLKVKEKEKELENQTEKIYEDDNFLVVVPKTIEASCKYGSGTKWCTTVKGADHFQRYTSGKQGLYYIIRKKGNQTEPHYKVAVHIGNNGNETWWDSKDRPMTDSSIQLFKEYFYKLWESISEHNKEKKKVAEKDLDKIFEVKDQSFDIHENFHNVANEDLKLVLTGYDLIPDMSGKAVGNLKIYLNDELLDEYHVFVSYSSNSNNKWNASVGFSEDFDEEPKFDFKLWEGWGFDLTNLNFTDESRISFDNFVLDRVYRKIYENQEFERYLKGITGPVWRPQRISYGYTFKENKGMIKKLVNWLDSDKKGTKLDFLTDIGVFEKIEKDGNIRYKRPNSTHLYKSGDLRGQFSGFFVSAKLAGILDYEKDGRQFYLKKGPNFEAFKSGELKAL